MGVKPESGTENEKTIPLESSAPVQQLERVESGQGKQSQLNNHGHRSCRCDPTSSRGVSGMGEKPDSCAENEKRSHLHRWLPCSS